MAVGRDDAQHEIGGFVRRRGQRAVRPEGDGGGADAVSARQFGRCTPPGPCRRGNCTGHHNRSHATDNELQPPRHPHRCAGVAKTAVGDTRLARGGHRADAIRIPDLNPTSRTGRADVSVNLSGPRAASMLSPWPPLGRRPARRTCTNCDRCVRVTRCDAHEQSSPWWQPRRSSRRLPPALRSHSQRPTPVRLVNTTTAPASVRPHTNARLDTSGTGHGEPVASSAPHPDTTVSTGRTEGGATSVTAARVPRRLWALRSFAARSTPSLLGTVQSLRDP